MALKKKISATAYEALNDALKSEYVLVGEDYVLDVEGDDRPSQSDLDALKQAKQHEKEARQKAEKELRDLKAAGDGAGEKAVALQEQLDALNERLSSRDNSLKRAALENAASKVTAKSKSPNVLKPHVIGRMQADIDDSGDAVVSILGKDGKVSKLSLDDLAKEFCEDAEFASLMLGSQSSGSGASGDPAGGGGKAIKDMSEAERVAEAKADPKAFAARVAAESTLSA